MSFALIVQLESSESRFEPRVDTPIDLGVNEVMTKGGKNFDWIPKGGANLDEVVRTLSEA